MVRLLQLWSGWAASWASVRRTLLWPSTKSNSPHAIRAALAGPGPVVALVALVEPVVLGPPERLTLLAAVVQELAALPVAAVQGPVLALALGLVMAEPAERVVAGPARLAAAQVWRTRS
jgi:hypothetical protein